MAHMKVVGSCTGELGQPSSLIYMCVYSRVEGLRLYARIWDPSPNEVPFSLPGRFFHLLSLH